MHTVTADQLLTRLRRLFGPAIVQLNAIGIMHVNVSKANMMALRTNKGQSFLGVRVRRCRQRAVRE